MTDIAWRALTLLDAASLQQELLRLSDDAMRGLTGAAEDGAARQLPEPLRVMWLVNWLDFEVAQGSFLAYFYNSHGRFAAEAASALDAIGADGMATVVRDASAAAAAGDDERLEQLTADFWRAAAHEDWGSKLDRFLLLTVERLAMGQAK